MSESEQGQFSDRNIVVTGGRGALGADIVSLLIRQGATCWIPTYKAPPTESPKNIHYIGPINLTIEKDVQSFFDALPPLWASVHVAGGFAMASITDTSFDDFQAMWSMNTASCFMSCREAVKNFRQANDGGRIVNVAARPAVEPVGGMLAYTTSKAGVTSVTQCLAKEVASEGISVNAILPAIIDTPANRDAMPDADHAAWPKTTEIAHTIAALLSPQNTLTTGALIPIYGKLT